MEYLGKMDKECIALCDALNELEGVRTVESCCGHLKNVYSIWLRTTNIYSLSLIARSLSRRYSGTTQEFKIEVESEDAGYPVFSYYLHSKEPYKNFEDMNYDTKKLIENLEYWKQDLFKDHFNGRTD
jgi:hypothetical protein